MMNQKLAHLLLYVTRKMSDDTRAGKTKLHKILFFADFEAYRRTGSSITGEYYVKFDQGPFLPTLDSTVSKMANRGDAEWAPQNQWLEIQLVPRAEPDLDLFTGDEIAVVDETIERFRGWTATAVSNFSHRLFGWVTTRNGDEIPYSSAYVGDPRELSDDETSWACSLIDRYREWKHQKAEYCP